MENIVNTNSHSFRQTHLPAPPAIKTTTTALNFRSCDASGGPTGLFAGTKVFMAVLWNSALKMISFNARCSAACSPSAPSTCV